MSIYVESKIINNPLGQQKLKKKSRTIQYYPEGNDSVEIFNQIPKNS